jgi:hypothetical protein
MHAAVLLILTGSLLLALASTDGFSICNMVSDAAEEYRCDR